MRIRERVSFSQELALALHLAAARLEGGEGFFRTFLKKRTLKEGGALKLNSLARKSIHAGVERGPGRSYAFFSGKQDKKMPLHLGYGSEDVILPGESREEGSELERPKLGVVARQRKGQTAAFL